LNTIILKLASFGWNALPFKNNVWINPSPEDMWEYSESTRILKQTVNDRMFPLTMQGLTKAMNMLKTANKRTVNPTEQDFRR
jgi:hypothetical protein